MRIWSKSLIRVLPNKQLKAMRYELGDMIKQWPNIKHPLVKFANNYDIMYLYNYFWNVLCEFDKRNIRHNKTYDNGIKEIIKQNTMITNSLVAHGCHFKEDNNEYLQICYWNLYEKYLRNMITNEEWQKIEDFIESEVD